MGISLSKYIHVMIMDKDLFKNENALKFCRNDVIELVKTSF